MAKYVDLGALSFPGLRMYEKPAALDYAPVAGAVPPRVFTAEPDGDGETIWFRRALQDGAAASAGIRWVSDDEMGMVLEVDFLNNHAEQSLREWRAARLVPHYAHSYAGLGRELLLRALHCINPPAETAIILNVTKDFGDTARPVCSTGAIWCALEAELESPGSPRTP